MPRFDRRLWLALAVAGLAGGATPAGATLPMPTYPQCGSVPDHPEYCPGDFGEPWHYISYIKDDYDENVRAEELEMGSGVHLDQAFALETGDFRITIASLDSGISWDEGNVRRKFKLNTAEMPLPQRTDGTTSSSYDLNGDGLVTIDDYASDPRVSMTAGDDVADDILDASDLIYTFSNGKDEEGNGYVDDIAGWDFLWNDNDPFDDAENQGYSHGTIQLRRSGSEGDDGGAIGSCPNCSLMMLRIGDSFISETSAYAQAVIYAVDMGAKVLQLEIGGLDTSSLARDAFEYAWSHGVTIIASAADEASIHANQPSALHHAIVVHPLTYSGTDENDSNSFLVFNNCSDFGGRPTMTISNDGCSSEATAVGAGLAGLVQSAALHAGLTLTSNEIYQIFVGTVDDVWVSEAYYGSQKKWYPSKPGFDRYFGYGRANIRRALDLIVDRTIPPEADLYTPDWFQVIDPARTPVYTIEGYAAAKRSSSYSYTVEYGIGIDPEPDEFVTITSGTNKTAPIDGVLAQWDLTQIPKSALDPASPIPEFEIDDDNVTRVDKINAHTVTVRVRVTDAAGLQAEMRKTLYLHTDPDLLSGFPLFMGTSLEASPRIIDLDGDGKEDIIQATADGVVHALRYDGSELPGWPVRASRLRMLDPALSGNHAGAPAYKSGAIDVDRSQSMIAPVAIGDLDNDGKYEVVAVTWDGEVDVWHANGQLASGFPVTIDYSVANQENAGADNLIEDGFFAAPALGDLDGDGYLDIIAAGMDQQVYAWDRDGQPLSGWPVSVRYPRPSVMPVYGARVVTAPAVGDVDGDGLTDVVVGTGEIVDYEWSPTYLIHGDGNDHPGGAFHRGWPVLTMGLYGNLLPDIGTGTTSSPVLADLDGDGTLEIATHTIAGVSFAKYGSILKADGSIYTNLDQKARYFGDLTNSDEPAVFPLMTSGAFGDMNQDGSLDYTLGMAGGAFLGDLLVQNQIVNATFATAAWDATTGEFLPGFPQTVADMQFLTHQILADVSGDGYPESISANGAFTLHGFDYQGMQPEGWPKFTGQWGIATPAVGDLDGDGYLELVDATRSGYLYVWRTAGKSPKNGGVVEWGSFHHDPMSTGNYSVDTTQFWPKPASRDSSRRRPAAPARPR